jgi:hypothetical protein
MVIIHKVMVNNKFAGIISFMRVILDTLSITRLHPRPKLAFQLGDAIFSFTNNCQTRPPLDDSSNTDQSAMQSLPLRPLLLQRLSVPEPTAQTTLPLSVLLSNP